MTDEANTAIKVILHENNEITVDEGRGYPVMCKDCRFSGWLYEQEYKNGGVPTTCLLYSGGADAMDGDRVIHSLDRGQYRNTYSGGQDYKREKESIESKWREKFPLCWHKNQHGKCTDYAKAKPISKWNPLRWFGISYRTRKMRK